MTSTAMGECLGTSGVSAEGLQHAYTGKEELHVAMVASMKSVASALSHELSP